MTDTSADDDDLDQTPMPPSCNDRLREQAEYYRTRLDHTLQHTPQATRLIYVANGAVLAALYFVADKLADKSYVTLAEAGLLILLSIMNFIHAVIIRKQGRWYSQIDIALARSVGEERVKIDGRWGSHRLYATLHLVLSSALLADLTHHLLLSQAVTMRLARTWPMPSTSRRRSGSASMMSNTFSPKARSSFFA